MKNILPRLSKWVTLETIHTSSTEEIGSQPLLASAPFGCPNTILLSETNISPLPLWIVEISSVGGSLDLFRNNPRHFFSTRS
jgi:hypothetical protein